MEPGDAPLMRSWAQTALDFFKDELRELEQLVSVISAEDAAATTHMREEATREVDTAMELQAGAARELHSPDPLKSPGSRRGTSGTTGGRAANGKKQQQQQQQQQQQRLKAAAQAVAAEQKALRAAERAAMIEDRFQRMREARDRQPWRQLLQAYTTHVGETERALEPVRARERREYEYFLSKPLEAFTMDEIVGTRESPEGSGGGGGQAQTSDAAAPPRQSLTDSTAALTTGFVMDARAFAEAYNAYLTEEYNYKPVFTGTPGAPQPPTGRGEEKRATQGKARREAGADTAGAAAAAAGGAPTPAAEGGHPCGEDGAGAALARKLMTHEPALGTLPPAFCVDLDAGGRTVASSLPMLASHHSGSPAPANAADGLAASLTSSVPTLPQLGARRGQAVTKAQRSGKAEPSRKTATSASLLKGIECSVRSRHVNLRAHTGTSATMTVRLTNRNANPTKLRLRPSSHPWLQYRCLRVAAVAGAAAAPAASLATPLSYSVEVVPLSCGGYMEVEITFTPLDLSQPRVDEVLQIGVTRELNARNGEGAQWSFYELPVTCETVLPAFAFFRREMEDTLAGSHGLSDHSTREAIAAARAAASRGAAAGTLSSSWRGGASTVAGSECSGGEAASFPPTFVCERKTRHYTLENTGSDCVVSVASGSPCFHVDPPPESATLLPRGCGMDITITFAPLSEGVCEGVLTVSVQAASGEGPVLSEHTVDLLGVGVVPRVCITRIGDVTFSLGGAAGGGQEGGGPGHERGEATVAELLARAVSTYILPGTCPEVPVRVPVVVANDSPVPLPYYWDVEAAAGGFGHADSHDTVPPALAVEPAVGVLPGGSAETTFTILMTPHTASPILASLNLFLVGLPDPAGLGVAGSMDEAIVDGSGPPGAIVELLRKDKPLPSALAAVGALALGEVVADSGVRGGDGGRVWPPEGVLADPYVVFRPSFQRPQAESASESNRSATFIAGLLLFAQPVLASVAVVPPVLEEVVECLAGLAHVRQVVLHNPSPCPVHFIWDPSRVERGEGLGSGGAAAVSRDGSPASGAGAAATPSGQGALTLYGAGGQLGDGGGADVDIRCTPRSGVIAANGSVTVNVHFTVSRPGPHVGTVSLYVPELDRGVVRTTADGSRDGPRRSMMQLTVSVRGIGPSVHVNTELLDFGFIEFGCEAEASFTVTNSNPVPVAFDLQDPMMREPPRFVFIPPAFRLSPGDSVEVTVYRKAVSVEDAHTYFELVVHDGGTIAIETRATIEKPTMLLEEATVNFGTVPEGVWQERYFYLTNLSAVDMPFTVELAATAPSPCVELELPAGVQHLRAGHKRCPVLVRARFTPATAPPALTSAGDTVSPYHVLLGVRSKRKRRTETGTTGNGQVLLLELCCDTVERLAVSVDVLTAAAEAGSGEAPGALVAREVPMGAYVRALLLNLLEHVVLASSPASTSLRVSNGAELGAVVPYHPYGAPVTLHSELPDDSPVSVRTLVVRVTNHSRCLTSCTTTALCYAPLPIITSLRGGRRGHSGSVRSVRSTTTSTAPRESSRTPSVGAPHPAPAALATLSHGSGGGASVAGAMAAAPPTALQSRFWSTAHNGTELAERRARAALVGAEALLMDGRRCVTTVGAAAQANPTGTAADSTALVDMGPLETAELPVTVMANLPGCYRETLRVRCAGLPAPLELPLTWEVRGRPVLLDPTTSGLTTTSEGHAVLVMPPTVACVGSSRRTLRVWNRSPRDLDVRVEMLLSGSTFAVTAVDDDVPAAEVVLTLGPIPESRRAEDQRRFGAATASPSTFFMPAMSTKEVHLTYTPDVNVVQSLLDRLTGPGPREHHSAGERASVDCGHGLDDEDDEGDDRVRGAMSQEVDWEGSLVVQAALAQSPFNDAFLMDEFYELHRSRYPSTRSLTILHDAVADGAAGGGGGDDDGEAVEDEAGGRAGTGPRGKAAGARHGTQGGDRSGSLAATRRAPGPAGGRPGPMLRVMRPLITRPGMVVRNSKLLKPLPAEALLVEHVQRCAESRAASVTRGRVVAVRESPAEDGGSAAPQTPLESPAPTSILESGGAHSGDYHGIHHDSDSSSSSDSDSSGGSGDGEGRRGPAGRPAKPAGTAAVVGSGVFDSPAIQAAAQSGTLRPLPTLLAEAAEREQLTAYLAARHAVLREEGHRYFAPIELRLKSRCGVPLLAVQPPDRAVTLPAVCPRGVGTGGGAAAAAATATACRRTIRLTNHNSAALYFALEVGAITAGPGVRSTTPAGVGVLRVMATELVPQPVSASPLAEEDGEGRLAGRAPRKLRGGREGAEPPLSAKTVMDTRHGGGGASGRAGDTGVVGVTTAAGRAGVGRTVYCLDGSCSMDVTVAYTAADGGTGGGLIIASGCQRPALGSTLTIQFFASHGEAQASAAGTNPTNPTNPPTTAASSSQTTAPAHRHTGVDDLAPGPTQCVHLRVPLIAARVSCQPAMLWFKPGQLVCDGRPQPRYAQRLRLLNQSQVAVSFELRPRSSGWPGAGGTQPAAAASSAGRPTVDPSIAVHEFKVAELMHTLGLQGASPPQAAALPLGRTAVAPAAAPASPAPGAAVLSLTHEGTSCPPPGVLAALAEERFTLHPALGTIPGATPGGEPGSIDVEVRFTEFSNLRFEREFVVYADGAPTDAVFLLRGDSRETEL